MSPLTPARVTRNLAALAATVLVAVFAGVALGPSGLTPGEVAAALLGDDASAAADIVWRVRIPRVALAAAVGASLATAGVLFQAILRNPLADPYILGVSGGAALAGVAVLALGGSFGIGYAAVPPAAFVGAIATLLGLLAVVGPTGRLSTHTVLLTGVVFNAFASAIIVFLASLSGFEDGGSIFLWLIGSVSDARADVAGWVVLFLVVGLACALPMARSLDLMALGEESASALGVDAERVKRILLVSASLMVGAAVAVAGLIGFVGLVVPHLLRLVLGPDHRQLVPAAALGGAAFLVVCDTVARIILNGPELPVGAVTALAGGPFFLWLLRRSSRGVA